MKTWRASLDVYYFCGLRDVHKIRSIEVEAPTEQEAETLAERKAADRYRAAAEVRVSYVELVSE